MTTNPSVAAHRTRRSPEEQIAALQAQVDAIKAREAARKAKKSPVLRHMRAIVRAIDAAVQESDDAAASTALVDARRLLVGCLVMKGVRVPMTGAGSNGQRASGDADHLSENLREYVLEHPGQRSEQIAAALRVSTWTLRCVMMPLVQAGEVRREGAARATAYFPA
ncbi:MAG: hypothetical protein Q8K55_02270 [Gemmatimonadaceae bacterium]|nr:hypothetical protein [Gemmatimonadaceae bacterium]